MARPLALAFAAAAVAPALAAPIATAAPPPGPPRVGPLAAPGLVRARAVNANAIRITWTDRARGESRYQIFNGVTSRYVRANSSSFVWSGIEPGSWMCSAVRALGPGRTSAWGPGETSMQRHGSGMWACTRTPKNPGGSGGGGTAGTVYWLSDFNAAQNLRTNTWGGSERINGTTYTHTVGIQQSWSVQEPIGGSWDLARRCSTLSFKAAGLVDKDSEPGARLIFTISTDGTERWRREIGYGESASSTNIQISNALRVDLATADPVGTKRSSGGFGDLVIRCTSEPPNHR